jgi:glucosamine-6-phosphate deaminase
MNLQIVKDERELGQKAAGYVSDFLAQNPQATLVVPTGNTPLPMYRELVQLYSAGKISFKSASLLELDEYYGIPLQDPRNLFTWLESSLLSQVDFQPERLFRFDSAALDANTEALRMEEALRVHSGIDLLVLGLGPNGHIGFNEPGSDFNSLTRVVTLTSESIASNARYWGGIDKVPAQGFTLGLGILRQARHTILIVTGEKKAAILKQVLQGPITDQVPATCLHNMANVTILADEAASGTAK